ncbi:PREDICTED: NGFI-A-binding protein homolog [Ceratosolen solmsi marchali]|uniref:NGFI-A-binding protein homolog n=1 Tax=Ceratosolen solmsi marchali TaxID=326594 RepID=A0AAJ6YEF6_9HYME|nr:PREDICTED: NGFI-A-binding protein homolog [Ceratosolen solmsi marchali]
MPQNEAELQLYRVMQRASLLTYYDTLLEMGGDDVQQLCDAGEEEFLEIMALVGMASKPLHVRRLQKALQEWLTNPAMFQAPVMMPPTVGTTSSNAKSSGSSAFPCIGSYSPNTRQQIQATATSVSNLSSSAPTAALSSIVTQGTVTKQLHVPPVIGIGSTGSVAQPAASQLLSQFQTTSNCCSVQRRKSPSPPAITPSYQIPNEALASNLPHSPGVTQVGNYESSSCGSQGTTPSPGSNSTLAIAPSSPTTSLQPSPVLLEPQVQRLADAAERLAATLRPLNPKPQSGIKKKICKNLEMVMAMSDNDPRRMEEIRKYAAIYGRFDCKRKPEKPLTLHEVSVNEAAAQICRFVPALLTRRDELFPLARRVVRDSGHHYTKSLLHSTLNASPRMMSSRENGDSELSGGDETSTTTSDIAKRRKLDMRCEDETMRDAGNNVEVNQQQAEATRLRYTNYNRGIIGIDSDSNSIQVHQNRHRKRQRRRRPSKINHKSMSSPIWNSCSDNSHIVLDGIVEELEDSDGCYSSFDEDWDDCNDDECDNFGVDTDDGQGNDCDDDTSTPGSLVHCNHCIWILNYFIYYMQSTQSRIVIEEDESCTIDKENDFNLKVIASCGDNIIAVANPALMNRNQPNAITKEQPIKEEIPLRDRRD